MKKNTFFAEKEVIFSTDFSIILRPTVTADLDYRRYFDITGRENQPLEGVLTGLLVSGSILLLKCKFKYKRVIISMKTFVAKPETVKRDWYVVDAEGKTLGRLASEIASRLRGKHKAEYTPHVDTGDYIIVINAEKVAVTGNKAKNKVYYRHSEFPGGLKSITFEKLIDRKPEMALELAVKGMLPRGPLGRAMYRKLKVYAGAEHNHVAQQPQVLDI